MRILLFLATNLAVILVASFTLRLLGVDSYLAQQGIDYGSLLAFAAVFGVAGAFISLFLSKPMAKWSTKARVIDSPRTPAPGLQKTRLSGGGQRGAVKPLR